GVRLFLATAAAAAARFFLFRFAAAAVALSHAGRAFIGRWLLGGNVSDHLGEFQIFSRLRRSAGWMHQHREEKVPARNHKDRRESSNDSRLTCLRLTRPHPSELPKELSNKPARSRWARALCFQQPDKKFQCRARRR